jgi:hypothetical protein
MKTNDHNQLKKLPNNFTLYSKIITLFRDVQRLAFLPKHNIKLRYQTKKNPKWTESMNKNLVFMGRLDLTSKHMLPGVYKMLANSLRKISSQKMLNHIGFFPITFLGRTDVDPKEGDKTQGFLDPYQSA